MEPDDPNVSPSPDVPTGSARGKVIAGVIAAVVLIAGGITTALVWPDDAPEESAATAPPADEDGAEIMHLQPANDLGPDTFTEDPLASDNPDTATAAQLTEVDQVVQPAERASRTRVVTGGEVGLYGGTSNEKVCDKQQLIDFLDNDKPKAKAWVKAMNADPQLNWSGGRLTVDKIADYINEELTPTLVLRDTVVVNHGFRNGQLTTFNSTLEAGTKAMVDKYGVFRVRCYCGNPLIGPRPQPNKPTKLTGKAWPDKKPKGPSPSSTPLVIRTSTPSATPQDTVTPSVSDAPKTDVKVPEVIQIREAKKPLESIPMVQPDGKVVHIRAGSNGLLSDAVDPASPSDTPSPTPSDAATTTADPTPTSTPTVDQTATEACAASFCVPLRPNWTVESADGDELRLIDSKGRPHVLIETSHTDIDTAMDEEKARRESASPPCTYIGSRDPVAAGPYTLTLDRWSGCDIVNTVGLVSATSGRVIVGASSNDGELRNVLFGEMRFQ